MNDWRPTEDLRREAEEAEALAATLTTDEGIEALMRELEESGALDG